MTTGYYTVQELIDEGMAVHAYCQKAPCHHRQNIDLEMLRDKLGPDAPAMADDLKPKLRCSKCGGKQIGLIYSVKSNARMYPQGPR